MYATYRLQQDFSLSHQGSCNIDPSTCGYSTPHATSCHYQTLTVGPAHLCLIGAALMQYSQRAHPRLERSVSLPHTQLQQLSIYRCTGMPHLITQVDPVCHVILILLQAAQHLASAQAALANARSAKTSIEAALVQLESVDHKQQVRNGYRACCCSEPCRAGRCLPGKPGGRWYTDCMA
jgi:hypothetical protein